MFVLVPTGDLSSQSSDTLMSRRGISIPLRVCGSAVRKIPPGLRQIRGGLGVRPVPSELGRGGLSRFSVLLDGLMLAAYQSVTPVRVAPQTAVN